MTKKSLRLLSYQGNRQDFKYGSYHAKNPADSCVDRPCLLGMKKGAS
mgnify:CR=1 FL=1